MIVSPGPRSERALVSRQNQSPAGADDAVSKREDESGYASTVRRNEGSGSWKEHHDLIRRHGISGQEQVGHHALIPIGGLECDLLSVPVTGNCRREIPPRP